ncbi:MAG TPA: FAD-binding protein, partial [Anaerolineae bacterium]
MRRWNGWGDETTDYALPASAARYLEAQIGAGTPFEDVSLEKMVTAVPESPLGAHVLITPDSLDRLLHARGQSLPDWVAMRSGRIGAFPDGIAYPVQDEDVRALFEYARRNHVRLIPYGGGTSVVGHINPRSIDAPTLTIDLSRLNRLI